MSRLMTNMNMNMNDINNDTMDSILHIDFDTLSAIYAAHRDDINQNGGMYLRARMSLAVLLSK